MFVERPSELFRRYIESQEARQGRPAWEASSLSCGNSRPAGRRRSLAHEFKHLLDWSKVGDLYRDGYYTSHYQAERAADAFAAALLMPKAWVKRAFYDQGIRDEYALARRFQVSVASIRWRVDELRLYEPAQVAA
jgi:Zn-dependent peptidase ImmA (M78 family)